MKTIIPVLLFFASNAIGFAIIVILYALAPIKGIVDVENTNFLLNQESDILTIMLMWMACAIFSFASFFITSKWKIFFLTAPIVIPLICSLKLLSAYT